jgi:hypothetical protein
MKRLVFVLVIVSFLPVLPVWAEMYRYKDAGGTIRFTDNLADVPEKQRVGLSGYENTLTSTAPSVNEKTPGSNNMTNGQELKAMEKPRTSDAAVGAPQSEELSDDPARIDRFLKIKTALDIENAQFIKESIALSEEEKTISGKTTAIHAYNEKVNALNARVDDYEKRRAAFQQEADAFDAALKKRLAPPPQSAQ